MQILKKKKWLPGNLLLLYFTNSTSGELLKNNNSMCLLLPCTSIFFLNVGIIIYGEYLFLPTRTNVLTDFHD